MLLVHGAQMCSGEQAVKIDNQRTVAVLSLHFFLRFAHSEGVMEKCEDCRFTF